MKISIIAKIILCFIILLFALMFTSCSVQKRCQRHLSKAKDLGCYSLKNDTIVKYDTLVGYKIDTLFTGVKEIDTFTLIKEGVQTTTIVKWRDKLINQTQTKKDTIIKRFEITRNHEIKIEVPKTPNSNKVIISLMGLVILLLGYAWIKK